MSTIYRKCGFCGKLETYGVGWIKPKCPIRECPHCGIEYLCSHKFEWALLNKNSRISFVFFKNMRWLPYVYFILISLITFSSYTETDYGQFWISLFITLLCPVFHYFWFIGLHQEDVEMSEKRCADPDYLLKLVTLGYCTAETAAKHLQKIENNKNTNKKYTLFD